MIHFLTNSWKKLKIMKSTLPKHSIWIQSEQKQGSPHHTQQTQHTAADSTWLAQTWQRSSADTWSVVPFVTTKLYCCIFISITIWMMKSLKIVTYVLCCYMSWYFTMLYNFGTFIWYSWVFHNVRLLHHVMQFFNDRLFRNQPVWDWLTWHRCRLPH